MTFDFDFGQPIIGVVSAFWFAAAAAASTVVSTVSTIRAQQKSLKEQKRLDNQLIIESNAATQKSFAELQNLEIQNQNLSIANSEASRSNSQHFIYYIFAGLAGILGVWFLFKSFKRK